MEKRNLINQKMFFFFLNRICIFLEYDQEIFIQTEKLFEEHGRERLRISSFFFLSYKENKKELTFSLLKNFKYKNYSL